MSDTMKLRFALLVCKIAHRKQRRKYDMMPYWHHPLAVAMLVKQHYTSDWRVLTAALLHDTVEDTWMRLWMIRVLFGKRVRDLVEMVTDVSKPGDGNRAFRKELDRIHLSYADKDGQSIKLADLIDNTRSIIAYDKAFAKVYLAEKQLLLDVLDKGDAVLHREAQALVCK